MKRTHSRILGGAIGATLLFFVGACGNGNSFLTGRGAPTPGGIPTLCVQCAGLCCDVSLGSLACCPSPELSTSTSFTDLCEPDPSCNSAPPVACFDCTDVCCGDVDPASCCAGEFVNTPCAPCNSSGDLDNGGGGSGDDGGGDDSAGGGGGDDSSGGGGGGGDDAA